MNLAWLYVGVLYAAAVALARRSGWQIPWRIAAFFYALVLIFFFRPMTQQYVNVPADFLGAMPPWSHVMPSHPANRENNDVVLQMVPWAHVVREQWKSLQLPLWNPYSGSGSILLGNGQSAALSPLRLLTLPLPLGYAFTAEAAMKLLIAMTFTFLFCRRRGYSDLAGAAAAIAFGFSMFFICWLHFPHATVAAYLPAAVFQADLLAERITIRRIAFGAFLWSAILLGGHPETASHIFFFIALIVIWIVAVERPFGWRGARRYVTSLIVMMVLATLIASPFLVSFGEALRKSQRYQQLRVQSSPMLFNDWQSAVDILQPHFFGPMERDAWGPWWAGAETVSAFAGTIGIAGWVAMLIETIALRRWRTREAFFVLVVPLLLGVIFSWPGIGWLFHSVFAMAANARVRLLLCFVVSIQTAAAIDLAERGRRLPLMIGLLATAAALASLLFMEFPTRWDHDTAILAMFPTLLVLGAGTWLVCSGRTRPIAAMATVTAIVVELWAAGWYWNPVLEEKRLYPMTPMLRKLQLVSRPANPPFRIAGVGAILFPNSSAMYDLQDIRAHDPMSNGRYLGLLRWTIGYRTDDYFARLQNTETPILDYLNVRFIITDFWEELPDPRYRLIYSGKDGRLYQNQSVLPRFFPVPIVILEFREPQFIDLITKHRSWHDTAIVNTLPVENDQMRRDLLAPRPRNSPQATLTLTRASATDFSMHVRAPRYTLVVSSQPFWPGWRVERNGETILSRPVNGAFLGFTVPPGESDIRVRYFPIHIYAAFVVSLVTVIALIVVSLGSAKFSIQPLAGETVDTR